MNQNEENLNLSSPSNFKKVQSNLENTVAELITELSRQEVNPLTQIKSQMESLTEHVDIVMYRHTNGSGRLFGGSLLKMIDTVGAICAKRHSGCEVTTVAIDHLEFKAPAEINDTLFLTAQVEKVGRTSMKIKVISYVESLDLSRKEINVAFLTFVALDAKGRPTPVPRLGP